MSFSEALHFLGELYNLPVVSREARMKWASRTAAVEREAAAFVAWKQSQIATAMARRNEVSRIYHNALRYLIIRSTSTLDFPESERVDRFLAGGDTIRLEFALHIAMTYEALVEDADHEVDRLRSATYSELLPQFKNRRRTV